MFIYREGAEPGLEPVDQPNPLQQKHRLIQEKRQVEVNPGLYMLQILKTSHLNAQNTQVLFMLKAKSDDVFAGVLSNHKKRLPVEPGGDGGAAAQARRTAGAEPGPGAADPAGGAAAGGRGAGGLCAAELHRGPAPRPEPDPAGPRHIREPLTDLCLPSSVHAQVRVGHQGRLKFTHLFIFSIIQALACFNAGLLHRVSTSVNPARLMCCKK